MEGLFDSFVSHSDSPAVKASELDQSLNPQNTT